MLEDQNKYWAPHEVSKTCVECLRQWKNGQRKILKFGIPMVWREPTNHHDDCYFSVENVKGFNGYKKSKWEYPYLESARRPIPYNDNVPIQAYTLPLSYIEKQQDLKCNTTRHSSFSEYEGNILTPQQFTQTELNDLVQDLNLSKRAFELLASRLKEKNCLKPQAKITTFRSKKATLLPYFIENKNIVYCNNIPGLAQQMGAEFQPNDSRLFIDSSTRSLKYVYCIIMTDMHHFQPLIRQNLKKSTNILKWSYTNSVITNTSFLFVLTLKWWTSF